MSIDVLSWVLKHSEETLGRRLVLMAIADCAHDDGTGAWPSVDTLAERSRLSPRQVRRCLRELEVNGSIVQDGIGPAGTKQWSVIMEGGVTNCHPDKSCSDPVQNVRLTVIEPEGDNPPAPHEVGTQDTSPAIELWGEYLAMRDRSPKPIRNRVLDPQTRRMIEKALLVGTREEWKLATRALLLSQHHVGKNDRRKVYLDPRHIFTACSHGTTRQHLDWLLDIAQTAHLSPDGTHTTSADDAKIREAKRNVLTAHDLAGSGEAKRSGDESERWLAQQGIRVVRGEGERPCFEDSPSN